MGEKLDTIIQALESRMDTGILHDLNVTRLYMLIGEEIIKKSISLPDDEQIINSIESAMKKYFNMELEASAGKKEELNEEPQSHNKNEQTANELQGKAQAVQNSGPSLNFKLNIQKNKEDLFTRINNVSFLFSPNPLRAQLSKLLQSTFQAKAEEYAKTVQDLAYNNSILLMQDIFKSIDKPISYDEKIRLGLAIFRLLGYGSHKLQKSEHRWSLEVTFLDKIADAYYFAEGFIRGLFYIADTEKIIQIAIIHNAENLVITVQEG